MAPVDDSLAGELSVPKVGRRDGVGVYASIGIMLSTGGVAPAEVGREKQAYRDFHSALNWRTGLKQMLSQV